MSTHTLAFKVLRLRPSDLADSDQSKSHFDKVVPSAKAPFFRDHPLESDPNEHGDQLNDQEKPQLGVSSAQNFGTVYLGQTLTVAIALCNISANTTVHNVGIRVEIQSEHRKKVALLYDTMPTQGIPSLPPGGTHEFIVKHDVRDLGAYTLLCGSSYITATASAEAPPKYSSQAFSFTVLNPLVVRTKNRALGSSTVFLEAVIENKTEDAMLLESVELAVATGYSSQNISNFSNCSSNNSIMNTGSSSSDDNTAAPPLPPKGGAAGYIFKLTRLWQSSSGSNLSNQDGSALGKLDIQWKGALGDPARLQTQVISGNSPLRHRELRLEIVALPERIVVAEPFKIEICVVSGVDRRLGPLKVSYHAASALNLSLSAPVGGGSGGGSGGSNAAMEMRDGFDKGIVLDGLQSECINEISPQGRATVTLSMLPRVPGRQYIQGLILTDERDGRVFDTLAPIEVFVEE